MIVISALCYASLPTLAKIAFAHGADPHGVLGLRFAIAAPVLLALIAKRRGLDLRRLIAVVGPSSAVYCLQTLTFFEALARMSAAVSISILFSYPLIIAAWQAVFRGGSRSFESVALIVLGCTGVCLSLGLSGRVSTVGVALASLSAVLCAAYFLTAKRLLSTDGLDGLMLTALTFATAGIGFPVLMAATGGAAPGDGLGWLAVGTIAIVCTVLAAVLLYSGLSYLDAGTAALLSAAEAPLAVAFAAVLLGEALAPVQIVGILCVVIALARLGYRAVHVDDRRPSVESPLHLECGPSGP